MAKLSPDKIADIILGRRQVYDLNTDSHIRQIANRLTARALFELLARFDDESPDFGSHISAHLPGVGGEELYGLIGFDTGENQGVDPLETTEQPDESGDCYLKLVFCDEQAGYYQFPIFPDLSPDYVLGATRKRAGAVQHIRITLSRPQALQTFIESCRSNPHFVRVEESTADEFENAPSNGS
jgi:hypothetical protein